MDYYYRVIIIAFDKFVKIAHQLFYLNWFHIEKKIKIKCINGKWNAKRSA